MLQRETPFHRQTVRAKVLTVIGVTIVFAYTLAGLWLFFGGFSWLAFEGHI